MQLGSKPLQKCNMSERIFIFSEQFQVVGPLRYIQKRMTMATPPKTPHLKCTNSFWIYSLHWFGLASKGPPADSCSRPECCTLLRRSPCVNFLAVYFMVVNQAKAMDKYDNAMFCQRWILDVSFHKSICFSLHHLGKFKFIVGKFVNIE